MSTEQCFVVEITLTVDGSGTQQTFLFSTLGFTTRPGDTPGNTVVREYLLDPGSLTRDLFTGGRVGGPVRASFGQLVLNNADGVLDDWVGYGVSGGRVVLRLGDRGAAYPAGFSTVFIAYAYRPIVDFEQVRLVLRDRMYKLDSPVVTDTFSGGGGLEGTGIAQQTKQMCFGTPGYFPPILIDATRHIYFVQANAADERAFRATNPPLYLPFIGGRGLNFDGFYASEAELLDGPAPAAGKYKVYGPGVDALTPETTESTGSIFFRLAAAPEYELRIPSLGLLKRGPGELAKSWTFLDLLQRAGVPADLAPGSYLKNAGNYLCDGAQTYVDVMTDACKASFSAYGMDRLDRFFTIDLRDPTEGADPSVMTFNRNNALNIKRQAVPGGEEPASQVTVNVGRTWPTSSLRTDLTAEERELFQRSPFQATFTGTSAAVRAANPAGTESARVEIKGNELRSPSAKAAFVRRFIYLHGARRELITLDTPLNAQSVALQLHDKVTLRMPRFGCDAGRLFRIVTIKINCKARTVSLGLWGGPPGPDDAVLGGGNQSPGGGTGQVVLLSGEGKIDEFELIAYGRKLGGGSVEATLEEFGLVCYGRKIPVSSPTWDPATVASPHVLSDSNRRVTQPASNTNVAKTVRGSRGITSGKWYWEIIVVDAWPANGGTSMVGMVESAHPSASANLAAGTTAESFGWLKTNIGSFWRNGAVFAAGSSFERYRTLAFAFDADAGSLWIGQKITANTGDPITWEAGGVPGVSGPTATGYSTSETYYPAVCPWSSSPTDPVIFDIRGAGNTDQPPPSGFTAYSNP